MAAADQFCLDCQQLRHHPLLRRCAPHGEGSILPALSAIVREPQKGEGLRLTFTTLLPVLSGEPPKLDHQRSGRLKVAKKICFEDAAGPPLRPALLSIPRNDGVCELP